MLGHVAVSPEWALPEALQASEKVLRAYDPALRLRRSADHAGFFVLERLTAQTKPVDTSAAGVTDLKIATTDGYLHVAHVHPYFVHHPDKLLERLLENDNDLHALGTGHIGSGAARYVRELRQEQDAARDNRRRHRRQELEGFYAESFDVLDRLGDGKSHAERMRLNNVGAEAFTVTDRRRVTLNTPCAGESPAGEISHEHPPRTPRPRESGQLPDPAVA